MKYKQYFILFTMPMKVNISSGVTANSVNIPLAVGNYVLQEA